MGGWEGLGGRKIWRVWVGIGSVLGTGGTRGRQEGYGGDGVGYVGRARGNEMGKLMLGRK